MGYLNNASVTVDAILTTKGREKLAKGSTDGLGIAYFALGDDEINYDLWNPAHPLGSDYYGIVIENMPVLEASPIPSQNLKSKLITLDKGTTKLAYVQASPPSLQGSFSIDSYNPNNLIKGVEGITVRLSLANVGTTGANNNNLGYTVYFNAKYFEVTTPPYTDLAILNSNNARTIALGDSNMLSSILLQGTNPVFTVKVKASVISNDFFSSVGYNGTVSLSIIAEGNEIGGQVTIPVPVTFN